ncbi:MAG: hypothetical protein GX781_00695 [Clostridiales bacterium]|nr:hypothetical protein [Clostridiales bacterium]
MLTQINKKTLLYLVLTSVIFLALGLALGYGMQTQQLSGTALSLPSSLQNASLTQLEKAELQVSQSRIQSMKAEISALKNKFTQLNNTVPAGDPQPPELQEIVAQMELTWRRLSETEEIYNGYLTLLKQKYN